MRGKLFVLIIALLWVFPCPASQPLPPPGHNGAKPISEVPYYPTIFTKGGWEERGVEFRKWLSTGVRIGGGSGTMVHYDRQDNRMYIISCGHLFNPGMMSAKDFQKRPRETIIEVFYHNDEKLPRVQEYR